MAKYDKAQVAEYVDDLKTLDGETSWSANSTARPPLRAVGKLGRSPAASAHS